MEKYNQVYWDEAREGLELPVVTFFISFTNGIFYHGAAVDFYPAHHNVEYARAQGVKTLFMNTLFHQGFVDRVVMAWAGPRSRLLRRKVSHRRPIYVDETITGHGTVKRIWRGEAGDGRVDIAVAIRGAEGDCSVGECTLQLPDRAS